MGKNRFIRLAAWAMGAWAAGQGVFAAPAGSTPAKSFTGTFANDSDQREFFFTLASGGPVTVRTFSYAGGTNAAGTVIPAGGFDPTVSLYDSSGVLLAVNQDGGCGVVAADPVTSSCWDSYLPITLPAGTYRVVLTQSTNLPAGPTLADSFIYNPNNLFGNSNLVNNVAVSPFGGGTNFTQPPGAAPGGFWDFFPSQRTSAYAIDIIGAATAIAPAVSTSSVLPFGVSGTGYAPVTLAVQSATGVNYTWTPPATGLPPGLSMNTAGVISGTPGSTGTFTFTVTATDGVQAVQQTETIIVYGPLSITTSSLPAGVRGQSYGPVQLVAAGGSGTQQWTASGLTGLTLSASGSLSGTTPASVPSFSVTATDPVTGQTATATYSITVTIPPLLVSGGGTLTEIAVGSTTSASFGASGGTPPYTFTSSSLPPGFSLSSTTGAFSGTGTTPGNFAFAVNIADSGGQSGTVSATLAVLGFSTTTLPSASTTSAYSFSFTGVGGTGSYNFSATGLPAGLSLSTAGVLSGTPKSGAATFTFTITLTDGLATASASVSLVVISRPISVSLPGGTLTGGQAQVNYTSSVNAGGGTGPYTYTLTGGILPTGLSLLGNGQITGTPTVPGSFSFTVQAQDATGATASGSYTIVIGPAPLVLKTGNSLPNGLVGSDYPLQIISANGGLVPYTYSISSGSLPAGLSFSNGQISGLPTTQGTYPFTVTVTDSANSTASVSLSILINPAQADLILSDTFLTFNIMSGGNSLPTADNVTIRSSVVLQLLNYSYTVTPAVSWLAVTGSSTTTPGSLLVSLTNSALSQAAAPTPYSTSLQLTCIAPSPCAGHTQNVNIALNVTAPPPQLTVTSTLLAFASTTANPAQSSLPLGIQNSGGGSLGITSVTAADSWVTVTGTPGSVPSGPPVSITVTVNPSGLSPGYNSSSVTVNSAAGSVTVPVTLNISQNTTMTLSPATQQFSLAAGGTVSPNSGSFQVSVNGSQPVTWSASLQPGAAWLSLNTSSGTSSSGSAGGVSYTLNNNVISGLPAGTYVGNIQLTSGGVTNSPQTFQVQLIVAASTALPVPNPSPAGVLFQTGSVTSQAVSVQVSQASNTQSINYQASAATSDGANWLSVSPATGTTSVTGAGASAISVNPVGLAQGVYTGLVSYAFSAAAVRSVNVTYIVGGSASSVVTSSSGELPHATTCTSKQLVPTQTGLVNNFSQLATLSLPLKILLTDNCGNLVSNGQVNVTFSNGDAPITLTPVDSVSGIYTGTWTPLGISPQVSVVATATVAGLASGSARVNGVVAAYAGPVLTQNAVLSVYNALIGGAIAPGAILQIYGSNLAATAVTSSKVPLTTTLGSTSVSIGGNPVPLYYVSPTQINAQAPFELVPGNQYQVIVNVAGALTAPQTISIAPVEPGIAGYQNGQIIAQHLDGTLVSETSPAQPGTYVIFYLAGLGPTDVPVADGAGSPFNPLAHPVNQPTLTLNGVSQPYQFVGLTPGIVGLYQINFLVPTGTPNGDIQLVISQSGVPSNPVILPVHQ